MSRSNTWLFYLLTTVICSAEESNITVLTDKGEIVGRVRTLDVSGTQYNVNRYLGIPYAKPPVGELRFQKPQPSAPFTETFIADSFGNACQQAITPYVNADAMAEDCLYLNVFVPGRATAVTHNATELGDDADNDKGRAVMFYIHGGGFVAGSADSYVSDTLAAFGDVIVVTMNYRLGLFGFFTTSDAHAPGNLMLWDQHLALRWVHENIAGFGGDQTRITVFGESAGANSVFYQAMFPRNEGIMHRFISQSGYGLLSTAYNLEPEITMKTVASIFDCRFPTSELIVKCLQAIPYDTFMSGVNKYMAQGKLPLILLAPTIDGEFIRQNPTELMFNNTDELKMFQSVDAIIGVNSHEGAFLIESPDNDNFQPDAEDMLTRIVPAGITYALGSNYSEEVLKTVVAEYTDWSNPEDTNNIRLEAVRLLGDVVFTASSVVQTNVHANISGTKTTQTSTYFYKFSVSPSNRAIDTPYWIPGANHADDLGFVFGHDPEATLFPNPTTPQPWEEEISHDMMRYWSNFAKTGNPNSHDVQHSWPQYDVINRKSIVISRDTHITNFIYAREANFWYDLIPALNKAATCPAINVQTNCEDGTTNAATLIIASVNVVLFNILCLSLQLVEG